jgi:hypothetical protein
MGASKNRVTLKALANVSPGFALKPWVSKTREEIVRNPEGVARFCGNKGSATLSELRLREMSCVVPGLPKRNPGLELANAFSVIHFL